MAEEKKKKMSRSEKMYGDSPTLKRDEEDGKVKAKKPSEEKKKADEVQSGTDGAEREPMHEDMASRHAMDRLSMHHKHEAEHHAHKGGDKKDMHKRHLGEHKAMMKAHEKEMGGSGEGMIEKEENDKEGGE